MIIASAYFLNSLSIFGHSEGGFAFNANIYETNIVNLAIIWFILGTSLKDPLGSMLFERKAKIVKSIQDAEIQLSAANTRLSEAEKQFSQLNLVLDPIRKDGDLAAKNLINAAIAKGKKDIEAISVKTKNQISFLETQYKKETFSETVDLALKKLQSQLETTLTQDMQVKIIDANISRLEGLS